MNLRLEYNDWYGEEKTLSFECLKLEEYLDVISRKDWSMELPSIKFTVPESEKHLCPASNTNTFGVPKKQIRSMAVEV